MPLPDELREAQQHLDQAARLVAGATSKYLEGRGVGRTAVAPLGHVLQWLQDARVSIEKIELAHAELDELGPDNYFESASK
jgi:hypothetical protein